MKNFTLKFLTFLILLVGTADAYGQCCTNCPLTLPESQQGDIVLSVTGAANNDLSSPGQGVCGVTVNFTHQYIGDLELVLTSPSGQSVTLIGPIGLFGETDFSTWNISFVPCSDPASPDAGHAAVFTNDESWGLSGNFTGSYYPHMGCLEDFNLGSVNGDWVLHWVDGQGQDVGEFFDYNIIFCDPTGVGCSTCAAEAGTISPGGPFAECEGSPLLQLPLAPIYATNETAPDPPGDYGYTYLVSDASGIIQAILTTPDFTTLPVGDYQVCGLSYSLADAAFLPNVGDDYNLLVANMATGNAGFCGDLSNNCVSVTVNPGLPDVDIDSTICNGDYVTWGGLNISWSGDFVQTTNDPNTGCPYDSILHLTVTGAIDPLFDQLGPFCESDAPVNLPNVSTNGISGTWNVNPFDPSVSVGQTTLTFTPSGGGCVNDGVMVLDVFPLPNITFNAVGALCTSDAAISLNATPAGGTFSGIGVLGGFFDPSVAGLGSHTVTYSYADANGCTNTQSITIDVQDCGCQNPPTVDAGIDQSACADNAIFTLNGTFGGGATSGMWTGAGTFAPNASTGNATYTPTAAEIAAGSATVTFTTDDPDGLSGPCLAASASVVLTINPLPTVNAGTYAPLCESDGVITLSGQPTGGVFSGTGVVGTTFDPSATGAGSHTIIYTYVDGNNCSNSGTATIDVNPLPTIVFTAVGSLCTSDAAVSLNATPAGGTYSGTGVVGSTFDPSVAGAGSFTVSYEFTDANGCTNTQSITIDVQDCGCQNPPTVDAGIDQSACADNAIFTLNGTFGGGATSGMWTGAGTFAPNASTGNATYTPTAAEIAAGSATVTFTTDDPDGLSGPCLAASASVVLTINPLPTVNAGTYAPLCLTDAPISLIGQPSGGVFTGPGVNAGGFDPNSVGAGSHVITYTFADGNSCANSNTATIVVNPLPIVDAGNDTMICANDGVIALVGNPTGGMFVGTGISGSNFDPAISGIGTFSVAYSYTDSNGCTSTDTLVVTVNDCGCATPATINIGTYSAVCADNASFVLNGMFGGGASSATWSGGLGTYTPDNMTMNAVYTPSASEIATGTVSLTLTTDDPDGNGPCTAATSTVDLIINAMPAADAGVDTTICADAAPINLVGTAGGVYSGNGVVGSTFDPSLTGSGSFPVVITVTSNGCTSTDTLIVTVNDCGCATPATINIGTYSAVCADNASFVLNGMFGGGASSATWSGGLGTYTPDNMTMNAVYTPSASEIATGTVSLTLTTDDPDGNGPCTAATSTVDLIINAMPAADAGVDTTICADAAPINLVGTAGGVYSGNGVVGSTFDPSLTGSGSFPVVITVTSNGCTSTDTLIVTVNDCGCMNPPQVNAGLNEDICLSSPTISLNGILSGSATSATWSGGTGTYSPNNQDLNAVYTPSQAELNAGSVTLTIITNDPDGSGPCTPATGQVTYTFTQVNVQGVTMANNGFIDCSGIPDTLVGSGTASNGGVVTGFWKDAAGVLLVQGDSLIAGSPGQYTYFVESAIGCVDSTTVTVQSSANVPDIFASASNTMTCMDTLIDLVGGSNTPNAIFSWTEPSGNTLQGATLTVDEAGLYVFHVLDPATNCPASMNVTVVADTLKPVVTTIAGEISCADTLADIIVNNVNNLDLAYSWLFPDAVTTSTDSSLIDMTQGGVYALHIVNNANGCVADVLDSIQMDTVGPENLVAYGQNLDCDNPTTQLIASTTTPNSVFEWNGPDNFKTNNPTPIIQTPGDYVLKAFGTNGCISETLIAIALDTVHPNMNPYTMDTIDCVNQTATLFGNTLSTVVEFSWYNNGNFIGVGDSIDVNGAGNYDVVATDQNNGCSSQNSVLVPDDSDSPLITLSVDGVINCFGNSVPATLNSNRPLDSISWSGQNLNIQNDTSIMIDEAGSYQIYIVGDNGCMGQKTFTVDADTMPPLAVGVAKFEVTCTIDKGSLGVDGSSSGANISYAWESLGAGNILNGAMTSEPYVQGAGSYLLTVLDNSNGCSATTEVELGTNGNIPVDLDYDAVPVQCNGYTDGAIIIRGVQGGESPYLYSLNDGPFGQNKIFSPIPPGEYKVVIQDVNGCTMERTLSVTEPDSLTIDLGPDQLIKLGDAVTVSATVSDPSAIQSFVWNDVFDSTCVGNPYCFTQDFSPMKSLTLRGTILDTSGCKATDYVNIYVDDTPNIYVPNIFSPNGDFYNDLFTVYSGQGVKEVTDLEVFDRWGTKVYHIPIVDGINGWDGFFRSKKSPEGVYIYQFHVLMDTGEEKFFKGNVTLIR